MRTSFLVLACLSLIACKKDKEDTGPPPETCDGGEGEGVVPDESLPSVMQITTEDGVDLIADKHTASSGLRPAVVLIHMDPCGGNNRGDWPEDFVTAMVNRDWTVLALDRRGAGDSAGDPEEAAGEDGMFDVQAAVDAVDTSGANPVVIIAASNGTTAMIDYELHSFSQTSGIRHPSALMFMGAGPHTEANTELADMPVVPARFLYEAKEASFHEDVMALDKFGWEFEEYEEGHGTDLFDTSTVAEDIEFWLFELFN